MNAALIHLAITHFPIAGVFIGVFLLAFGRLRKDNSLLKAANILFVICGLLSLVASFTGEGAEELIEHLPGVNHATIHEHEEAAEQAIWSACILGAVSLVALIFEINLKNPIKKINAAILILAIITFAFMARAGHKGGLIKHPEIDSPTSEIKH